MWLKGFCHLNGFHQVDTHNSSDKMIFCQQNTGSCTEVCLAVSKYTVKAGIRSWRLCYYKETRRRGKLSFWCQTVGSSLHERKRSLQGSISFLWAFTLGINQITEAKPGSCYMGVSLPTPLLILQSVDLFNVLITTPLVFIQHFFCLFMCLAPKTCE